MRLSWTAPALRDLTQICDYIGEHSSGAIARRVALSIATSVEILAEFPELGRSGKLPGTRELIFAGLPYLAIYRIGSGEIEILRVLHGAQNWP
jgi:toxin ParE1/3/4